MPGPGEGFGDPPQVEAEAHDLGDPVAAADDPDEPVRGDPAEVTGAQLADHPAEGEVVGVLGVAEHDARAGEGQLADLRGAARDVVVEAEEGVGDGATDGIGMVEDVVPGEDCHARGRLGLPVHDGELPPLRPAETGQLGDALGGHRPAGLGDQP